MSLSVRRVSLPTLLLVGVFGLLGCSDDKSSASNASSGKNSSSQAARSTDVPVAAGFSSDAGAIGAGQQNGANIAVTHDLSIRLPYRQFDQIYQAQLEACRKLSCQILWSQIDRESAPYSLSAEIDVRLPPANYQAFMDVVASKPARIVSHEESADDKSLEIIEVEKRLASKLVLRDRLTKLLETTNSTKIADLVALEKEITQVQQDIETAAAQMAYLKTITGTVRVNLDYFAEREAMASFFATRDLKLAVKNIANNVMSSLAILIQAFAYVLPWLPLPLALIWAVRRWRARRLQASKAAGS